MHVLFVLGHVGEGIMLFSLGQVLGLRKQSCGIYSKSIIPSLLGARWALRKVKSSDCFAILRNLFEKH